MQDILKVVNKAVGKSGGTFSYLRVDGGQVEANNGRVSILAEVPELREVTATVPAVKFIAAVRACKTPPDVRTTDSNLLVKCGTFSARIPLSGGDFPRMDYTEGHRVDIPPGFVDSLAIAKTFATSEHFNGVLLRGGRVYGLSEGGAVAIDGVSVPRDVVLPLETVDDIVSIKEPPMSMLVSDNFAVIEYASFKLRTSLVDKRWPDAEKFLSFDSAALSPIDDALRDAIATVLPFTDKTRRVDFTGDALTGGEATVEGIVVTPSAFNGEHLANAVKYGSRMRVTEDHLAQFTGENLTAVLAGRKR